MWIQRQNFILYGSIHQNLTISKPAFNNLSAFQTLGMGVTKFEEMNLFLNSVTKNYTQEFR